jgi:Tripartite tricarboxylate transporter TctB family
MNKGRKMITNQKDFVAGLLYITLGAAVAIMSWGYEIGTPYNMGPGFFPFGVGIALALVGACVFATSILPDAEHAKIGSWPLKRLVIVLLSVVLFGILLEPLGMLIAVPVLLGVSFYAHPEFSWRELLFLIVFLVPFTWAVFVLLLGLQFPLWPSFMMS